ncbi:MAG TPA: hypothetical protein VFF57_03585, partial [Hanamia sp.]|nr:hypothetical protein [Hanamia sp.]
SNTFIYLNKLNDSFLHLTVSISSALTNALVTQWLALINGGDSFLVCRKDKLIRQIPGLVIQVSQRR